MICIRVLKVLFHRLQALSGICLLSTRLSTYLSLHPSDSIRPSYTGFTMIYLCTFPHFGETVPLWAVAVSAPWGCHHHLSTAGSSAKWTQGLATNSI